MEIHHQTESLNIMYVTADTFPEGIMPAFDQLKRLLPDAENRTLFGISKPEHDGTIVYKAGALENHQAEAAEYNLKTFVLIKGDYLSELVSDWANNVPAISTTFDKLLDDARLDPAAYCVEWYKGADVMCMVKVNL
jgi:hypothetical protein